MSVATGALGADVGRLDGPQKVTGTATYAYEQPLTDPAYVFALLSTVARGKVVRIDVREAEQLAGVLAVLTHDNAPALADCSDGELAILQSPDVHFRGQVIGAVVAESLEIARHAAGLVRVEQRAAEHDVLLSADDPELYRPEQDDIDSADGDVEAALRAASTSIDATYRTPMQHNNPLEPHTSVALWHDGTLELWESTQSVHGVRESIAELFGLDAERVHVSAPYVGGGFGSKGTLHAPAVLAVMAAQVVPGRPVKLALDRRQMFTLAGHRTPTIQRVRLGAGADGRLLALSHDVWEHTSRVKEYVEGSAIGATRMMYASATRATTHRLAPLDVPVPSWMRAPGETPGMYALECAIDELAVALRIDPIELRVRNDPPVDPHTGKPWSSRNLVACLREGAERFGWAQAHSSPRSGRSRRDGRWLVGAGVAAATYPRYETPGSQAQIEALSDGRYAVRIGAVDVGTGTWTALTQIAAEALGVAIEQVVLEIGDTALPYSDVPGGSAGISSWGSTLYGAARAFRDAHGDDPSPGDEVSAGAAENPAEDEYSMHAFGSHFAEVRVDADTGEVRVSRMLGTFAVGRVVNPRTARSQLIGGMTFGLSMALHEEGVFDARLGAIVTADLAGYHVAANADVGELDARWIEEIDPHVNPMGTKGIGEIGIVGSAAAVANAVFHATGVRVRDLPITPDKLLGAR